MERPQQLRAINNVYKHQEGYIESASSRSAKYLVDSGYFKDETYLKWYSSKDILGDVELGLYKTFAHLYGVTAAIAGFPNILPKGSGAELIKGLKDCLVYSVIQGSLGGDAS